MLAEKKRELDDRIISLAVMIQSLLAVLQIIMSTIWGINHDVTTIWRVLLTGLFMTIAILIAVKRLGKWFLLTYSLFVILFSLSIVFFPANTPYILSQGFRFFFPIVVPSALCLCAVDNIQIVENVVVKISWVVSLLVAYYFYQYFRGRFVIEEYNMVFSYACLLPMLTLYAQKKPFPLIVSLLLFISVVAVGSRGAALFYILYVLLDSFYYNKGRFFFLLLLFAIAVPVLQSLQDWLVSSGIDSRTLSMLFDGDITDESGRDELRSYFINQLYEYPFIGIGLFGDRVYTEGGYCHNLVLEILLNFGLFWGGGGILLLLLFFVRVFIKSSFKMKLVLMRYFCALVLPLMASGSYLTNSGLAIFIGICYLIRKHKGVNDILTTTSYGLKQDL